MGICEIECISWKQGEEKLLKNLGMTQHIIRERESLFFYQLLLPMYDTPLSIIREGKWPLYYYEVEKLSNIYAYHIGLDGSYGYGFKHMKLPDVFFHDGYIVRDGVRGGTSGAIYCFWYMGSN